jgi:hypothetical protein
MTAYAGRGAGAARAAQPAGVSVTPGTCAVDLTDYLRRKLGALARHHTQYPVVPSMLPRRLLKTMLGTEFFLPTGGTNSTAAFSRLVKVAHKRPLPWTFGGVATPALAHLKSSLPILLRLRPWRGTPRPGEVSNG